MKETTAKISKLKAGSLNIRQTNRLSDLSGKRAGSNP